MKQIYVVDTRDKFRNYRKDPRVPFDKFYLVPGEADDATVARLVPYAIILPLNEHYDGSLKELGLRTKKLIEDGYKVLVPIHMARATYKHKKSNEEIGPTYMARRSWWKRLDRLTNFIPENAALTTPEGVVAPMCLSCSKSLEHIAGDCYIGTEDCVKNLRIRYRPLDEVKYTRLEDHLVKLGRSRGD